MNTMFSMALIISGCFIVCYPVVMFILNHIMNRIAAKDNLQ